MKAVLALAVLFLAGCGGSGGASQESPFWRNWSGTWDARDPHPHFGRLELQVDSDGNATGTMFMDLVSPPGTPSVEGTVTGTVDADGDFELVVDYFEPEFWPDSTISGTGEILGGNWVGTMVETAENNVVMVEDFILNPAP